MGALGFATSRLLRDIFGTPLPTWLLASMWTLCAVAAVWAVVDYRRNR